MKSTCSRGRSRRVSAWDQYSIIAYADWSELSRRGRYDIQRGLAQIGVETRYQINMRGKNSADMKIADDIRTLMEKSVDAPDAVDVIVLGTRDRDFRPLVETARVRGKRLVVVSLKNGLSRDLERVAGEVRYLDGYLPPRQTPNTNPDRSQDNGDLLADTAMRVHLWLRRKGYSWGHVDRLAGLMPSKDDGMQRIHQALDDGVLVEVQKPEGTAAGRAGQGERLTLKPDHPVVRAVRHLAHWAPSRVAYCLNEKGMPYVDSNFLGRGMQMDATCQMLQIGQNRESAESWLNMMAETGLLVRKSQRHPKVPSSTITTWWLPDNEVGSVESDKAAGRAPAPSKPTAPSGEGQTQSKQPATVQLVPIPAKEQGLPEVTIETGKVRQLLMECLSDEDIMILAFDHFPQVYERFSSALTRSAKVLMLVEHAERQGKLLELLTIVREQAPQRSAQLMPELAA